ncbi:DUF4249 domain-containing protein [Spirosoma pulveris]
MRHAYLYSIGFLLLMAGGCTPAADDILSANVQPVVQAYLVPGSPVAVSVTKQIPFADDTTAQGQPIDGLSLTITNNAKAYPLRSLGNGSYQAGAELAVKTGQTYQIDFDYSGHHVSGSTVIPTRPVSFSIDQTEVYRTAITVGGGPGGPGGQNQASTPVRLTWSNPTGDYYFVVVDNIEANPVSIITGGNNPNRPVSNADRRFRSQPVQSDFTTIQAQSFQYFGRYRVVLFHLNPDYAALYKQNSTSTQNISTPPTTLTNGLGLFTGINTDTLYVNVKQQ